jgi:PAS domain S-box-containing protein
VCPATDIPLQQVQDGRFTAVYSPMVALVPPLSSGLAWLTEFEDGIGSMKNSGSRKVAAVRKRPKSEPNPLAARIFHPTGEFPIVGVGASAGGLEAFSELLRHLPEKTGMAFVLVQHLDPTHGSMLKEILGRITKIPVTEVTDGLVVAPDHIYVIPANTIMFIEHGVLRLKPRLQTRGLYLPIDHFFQSLAMDRGNQAICVILSGTGSDGSAGCTAIKTAGGIGFAQDDQSAKYSSMPHSEQRMHSEEWKRQAALLELTHDSIIVRDFDGRILFWNPAAEKMYEWKREDAIGKVSHELLQTEFPKSLEEINAEFLRTGRWEGELVHVCGDGRRKTVNSRWALRRTSEGTPEVLEINSDITARRSSEDSLRQLSGYLMRVQDEERRRIARELHDSTGQKLIALKMNLEALRIQPNSAGETSGLLQQSVELVDETTQDIRTLAQLLHPPLLDEAGLISATRWLVDGFSQRAGIAIELVVPPEMGRLPENAEIALFRVIQESLNNVHRHAAAKKARIEIKRTPEAVTLEVSDDGKGLRPELGQGTKTVKPSFGVGILGMRERLSQLGGTLEISSKKKGTTVKAVLPSRQRPS